MDHFIGMGGRALARFVASGHLEIRLSSKEDSLPLVIEVGTFGHVLKVIDGPPPRTKRAPLAVLSLHLLRAHDFDSSSTV